MPTWLWQDILNIVAILAIALFAVNKVLPGVLSRIVTQQLDEQLESFKNSLQTVLERYKISHGTLHAARASIIADLYAKLLRAWWSWESGSVRFDSTRGIDAGALRAALAATDEFREVSYRSHLYLTSSAIELISSAQALFESLRGFVSASGTLRGGSTPEDMFETYEEVNEGLLELREALETEFRRILGAEDTL